MTRNCIVVDDEKLAREKITLYLSNLLEMELKGEYATAHSFLQDWKLGEDLLLFLDINLPDLNGLELAAMMKQNNQVIFTTAYSEYALNGFELDAVDYLLKPFSYERFLKAVQKAQNQFPISDFVFIKEGKKMHRLNFSDIHYIEGLKEYIIWHTERGKIIEFNSLKKVGQQLKSKGFLQIHKSFIINFLKINYFESKGVSIANNMLPIGRKFKDVISEYTKTK